MQDTVLTIKSAEREALWSLNIQLILLEQIISYGLLN